MDELEGSTPQRFFLTQYLNNPIIGTSRTRLLLLLSEGYRARETREIWRPTGYSSSDVRFARHIIKREAKQQVVSIIDPEDYDEFLKSVMTHSTSLRQERESRAFVASTLKLVMTALESRVSESAELTKPFSEKLSSRGVYWYKRWRIFDRIIQKATQFIAGGGPPLCEVSDHVLGVCVVSSSYVCILNSTFWPDTLFTYEQFLMFKDMCYSRYQVYAARQWLHPEGERLDVLIESQWEWQMECLSRYGNEGYEIAKNTESISKAYLSYLSDPVFGQTGAYPRMLEKVREKESALGSTDFLVDRYDALLKTCTNLKYIVELFGLQKICGHPFVDPARGGLSAAKEARSPDATLYSDAQRLRNNFCRIYLQAYVLRHKKWPPLEFTSKKTQLRILHNTQFRNLEPRSYPLTDWNHCRFKKHQEFDYHPNFLDLMDDKSISYYRSDKHITWKRSVNPKSHKRLLLEMLSRETIDAQSIVERVMKRDIPLDWFIVSLYPKEREFKLAARMFSMLVFEIRFYFALTEANLAESIFPYLPQQTMTKDKISVLRTFGDITRPMTSESRLHYFLEIDLSRWNLRWRSLTVHAVGDVVDDIFGLRGVYTFVHEFFSKCLIMVRAGDICPPEIEKECPPESDTLWYNHHGGFEGITQKLWSICTYSMVDLGVQQFPMSYILIGQADNQILSVTWPRDPTVSASDQATRTKTLIMDSLEVECSRTNQEMKPDECLESGTVLTYSKDVYIGGVDYHTSLKAHSRLFPNTSDDFPSTSQEIGTIMATALSGAERTRFPLGSYALGLLHAHHHASLSMAGSGIYGKNIASLIAQAKVKPHHLAEFILLVPSELGGIPVPSWSRFLYKGGSDPLSTSVAGVSLLGRVAPRGHMAARVLRETQDGSFLNPEPRLSALILDPYSVPIKKPSTPADRVASATLLMLKPHVVNRDLKELMNVDSTGYSDILLDHLTSMNPLNPLIAHDLYDCSVAGLVDTVSRMFTSTRSIQSFVRGKGSDVVETLIRQETNTWVYYINRLAKLTTEKPNNHLSIFDVVVKLRKAWTVLKPNLKIEGLTTYHPLDFEVVWGEDAFSSSGISILMSNQDTDPLYTRGPYDPYLGSKTREKRAEHGYRIVGTDTTSQQCRKLQLIRSQLGTDAKISALVDAIGLTRTDTLLSPISEVLTQVVGGTVSHRYAAKAGHTAAHLLGAFSLGSNCVLSSDNAGFLSGGYVDYPVMFQEFFLTLGAFVSLKCCATFTDVNIIGTIKIGSSELVRVNTEQVTVEKDQISVPILNMRTNRLAFLTDLQLQQSMSAFTATAYHEGQITKTLQRTPEFALSVATAWFRNALRTNQLSRAIADSASVATGRVFASLDLAETLALGMARLVDAAAHAMAEETIYNTWRTANKTQTRWRMSSYLWKLAEAISIVLSEHIGHPKLRSDYLCRRYSLYMTPRYVGGLQNVRARLAGIMCGRARFLINRVDSSLYEAPLSIFVSEHDRSVSDVVHTALCLLLHKAWKLHIFSDAEAKIVMQDNIIPLGLNRDRDDHRVQEAYAVAYRFYLEFSRRGHYDLAQNCQSLAEGRRVFLYSVSLEEVVRDFRNSRMWNLARADDIVESSFRPHTFARTQRASLFFPSSPQGEYGVRHFVSQTEEREQISLHQMESSKGKIYGMFSCAHYNFSPVASYLAGKDVLIVGVGHGAVARLALEAGADMVHGLDLHSSLPLDNHSFRTYKPPMVMECSRENHYIQCLQSFTTSGDWTDPSVSDTVLSQLLWSTMVVIDIQSGTSRPNLSLLQPLIDKRWRGLCVMRCYMTEQETIYLCSDLQCSGSQFSIFFPDQHIAKKYSTVIILIQRLPHSLKVATQPSVRVLSKGEIVLNDMSCMGGGRGTLVTEVVHNLVQLPDDVSLLEAWSSVDDLYLATKGDYLSRPTYMNWTLVLEALFSLHWLMCSSSERVNYVKLLAKMEPVYFSRYSVSCNLQPSFRLLRHITKTVSRLLT
nr:MAG: RNA-dependent RNA polymerase [Yellow silver pine associated mymonavirus 3]